MTDPDRPTDATRADLAERLEGWARPVSSTPSRPDVWMLLRADLREAAAALRSTPDPEQTTRLDLAERLTSVFSLLTRMESWNVSHGPIDDPTLGNLIVSAMNVIGDPRLHCSTPAVDPALWRQCSDSGHPPSDDGWCHCGFRSTPEAGERFTVEQGFDGEPVIVEQPPSPLLALAEELEARARQHQEADRTWATGMRFAARRARDYASREESTDV